MGGRSDASRGSAAAAGKKGPAKHSGDRCVEGEGGRVGGEEGGRGGGQRGGGRLADRWEAALTPQERRLQLPARRDRQGTRETGALRVREGEWVVLGGGARSGGCERGRSRLAKP